MSQSDPLIVIGIGGLRGVVVRDAGQDASGGRLVLVRFDDGRNVIVPVSALVRQADGTYALPVAASDLDRTRETMVLPVAEERLHVGKREVESVVRISKVVHEHEELVDEPLHSERATIERVPLNRTVERADGPRREGSTLVIPLYEEVLVVEKRLILREEVRVSLERSETHEPQRVTLRREDVVVERSEPREREAGGDTR